MQAEMRVRAQKEVRCGTKGALCFSQGGGLAGLELLPYAQAKSGKFEKIL